MREHGPVPPRAQPRPSVPVTMDPDYGARYRELYTRHWWWRARERVVLAELDRLRPTDGWLHILDVGCGDGLMFPALSRYGRNVEGVEPDRALVSDITDIRSRIHLGPFDTSFSPDHRYGLILFLDVLEHITDAEAAVDHAVELLEPGGVILVTVPAFRHLWTAHDDLNRHVTRYTRRELVALLSRGLMVERSRYLFRWVHAAKLTVRVKELVTGGRPAPPRIPPAPVNGLLYGACRIEEGLLGRVPLPLGSSLLAVARKG